MSCSYEPDPPTRAVGRKIKAAMASAEINAQFVFKQGAQTKFNAYRDAQGSQDEVYTDGFKLN